VTCGPVPVTFRLLEPETDWKLDLQPVAVTIDSTIELALLHPGAIDPSQLGPAMPPPWIARGCGPCDWYLACCPTLLRYAPRLRDCDAAPADRCAPPVPPDPSECLGWIAIAGAGCSIDLVDPVSVAATRDHVAVLDAGRHELVILSATGERVIATIPTRARGPIAFWNRTITVADHDEVTAYDLVTLAPRRLEHAHGEIVRMVAAGDVLWIAVAAADGAVELWQLDAGHWVTGELADLLATAPDTSIVADGPNVACIAIPRGGGEPRRVCIDRCGNPAAAPPPQPGPRRQTEGFAATSLPSPATQPAPIDSGVPRCVWHRVRIDLDLPERTGITVSLATVEDPAATVNDADWQHVDDPAAIRDFLIDQPPGRYLHVKIELRGDGTATPSIRRVRIDFPRSTSATRLPGVFRDDPIAADFLERFVSLFDASIEDLDRIIARFPALLDPASTPAEALAWVATFFDIVLDPAWPIAMRRAILAEAPELYRRRGTLWALARAIELTTGVPPAIQELGGAGTFARVAAAGATRGFRLNEARLFGAARARMRLDASELGRAPLRSYGDPDRDHVAATGWRISVQLPGGGTLASPDAVARLDRLVETQKPAHVTAHLRVGGNLAFAGATTVGIDTRLGGLPLPVLGKTTYLRRQSVLARGRARGDARLVVGTALVL